MNRKNDQYLFEFKASVENCVAGQRRVTYLGNVDVCDLVLMPDISLQPPSLPQSDWLSVWSSLDMWRLQTDCQMPEILIKCGAEFKISSR